MFLADLHIHSSFSDGRMTIPELVDFYGTRGFGAIAITDHICEELTVLGKAASYLKQTLTRATFPIYREILRSESERAWDRYRMVLLPGFELSKNTVSNHRSTHIVGLGRINTFEYVSADGEILDFFKMSAPRGPVVLLRTLFGRENEKNKPTIFGTIKMSWHLILMRGKWRVVPFFSMKSLNLSS